MKRCLTCGESFASNFWVCPSCGWTPEEAGPYRLFAPEKARAREGFEQEFFENLVRLEAENFWFVARNQLIVWAINKYFPSSRRVLEVGCGTGFALSAVAHTLPEAKLTASEVLIDGLAHAASRVSSAEFVQMDARAIPFESEFDLVTAFDVVEHIDEDEEAFREMRRATLPGGGLLLTVPQHRFLWSAADDYAHHKRRYARREMEAKIRSAGYAIVRYSSFVALLMPLMLLSRMRMKSSQHYDPLAEFRISNKTNRALGYIMAVEQALIRSGVSFPFGGSMLLVARRVN